MKKIEFEFPDEKETESMPIEVEPARNRAENVLAPMEPIDLSNDEPSKKKADKPKEDKQVIRDGDVEIEIEDDTPPEDRGRKRSEPLDETTDKDLEGYSKNVKKRIQHITKLMHDERRRADAAERERQAALDWAKQVTHENENLRQTSTRSRNSFIATAKKAAEAEVVAAQREYREAYNAGDADKLVEAQTKLTEAVARKSKLDSVRAEPLQPNNNGVQRGQQRETPQQPRVPQQDQAPKVDPELQAWMDDNSWFGVDDDMTGFVYGVHNRLKREKKPLSGKDYYATLDREVRKRFPEEFEDDDAADGTTQQGASGSKNSETVVAPVSRSSAPKRFKLSPSQVAIAKELGVPLERYAKQAAILASKEN